MEKIVQLGDVNPIEHGGGFVFANTGDVGTNCDTWEFLDAPHEDEDDQSPLTVYQRDVPNDVFDAFDWVEWDEICRYCEKNLEELKAECLTSIDARAQVMCDITRYYGGNNLDESPMQLTPAELKLRWFPEEYECEKCANAKMGTRVPMRGILIQEDCTVEACDGCYLYPNDEVASRILINAIFPNLKAGT